MNLLDDEFRIESTLRIYTETFFDSIHSSLDFLLECFSFYIWNNVEMWVAIPSDLSLLIKIPG